MDNGTLINIKGDVTSPQCKVDELAIIPHCCNNLGVMGAGVALSLKNKWPLVFDVYKKMEKESVNGLKYRLGENCYARVENNVIVVNMIGQDGVVSSHNSIPVKYWALLRCMQDIRANLIGILHMNPENEGLTPVIHTCKFGSDLAGGNWVFILELIREIWLEHGIDVIVYEFEPDKNKWAMDQLCPTCEKFVKSTCEYFPFCSKRCRMVDLNDWI